MKMKQAIVYNAMFFSVLLLMASPSQSLLTTNHHHHHHRTHPSSTSTTLNLFFDNFFLHPYGVSPHNNNQTQQQEDDTNNNYLLSLLLPTYLTPEQLQSQSKEEFQRKRLERQLSFQRNNNNKKKRKKGGFMADDDETVKKAVDMFQRGRVVEQSRLRGQKNQQQEDGKKEEESRNKKWSAIGRNNDEQQFLIKSEAFQRALLEERLKQQKQQQQRQRQARKQTTTVKTQQEKFVPDMEAMEQDKNAILDLINDASSSSDSAASSSSSSSAAAAVNTMDKGDDDELTNSDDNTQGKLDGEVSDEEDVTINNIVSSSSTTNGGGSYTSSNGVPPPLNNDKVMMTTADHDDEEGGDDGVNNEKKENGVKESASAKTATTTSTTTITPSDLKTQLQTLHRMVSIATLPVPPPPSTTTGLTLLLSNNNTQSTTTTSQTATTRLQRFLSTTHLPLPPNEHTPMSSLILAPLAHVTSSLFLSIATLFYATFAVLDVLLNDTKGDYCARSCIAKAMFIWKNCWDYLFQKRQQLQQQQQKKSGGGVVYRTMEASQTSLLALFYTCQCVLVRAATRTRYAQECRDAGLASLRYLIYALRSWNVLWVRVRLLVQQSWKNSVGGVRSGGGSSTNTMIQRKRRKFHLLRVLSNIRNSASERIEKQRSLLIKQQRMRAEKEFQTKLQLLNEYLDRVEKEKRQLDVDRAKLISEGVGVLAWYSVTKEASDALEVEREEFERERRKNKGGKRHWRPRFGYWAGLSGEDDETNDGDVENVEIDIDDGTENDSS